MKSAGIIRESLQLYLRNPSIILLYFFFGIFNIALYLFAINYAKNTISSITVTSPFALLIYGEQAKSMFGAVILQNLFFIAVLALLYVLFDSFVKAYTIGIAEKISRYGKAKLSDGIKTIHCTFHIFEKNIIAGLLLFFGYCLIFLTSVVLLGSFALLAFFPAAIIYTFIVFSVTLFASQSIVVENKGPWHGIVSGYKFTRKHMEDAAKLILFLIFVYVAFQVIRLASLRLLGYFFLGFTIDIISFGINLLLGYLIMRPYFIILKTHYFVKNQKAGK